MKINFNEKEGVMTAEIFSDEGSCLYSKSTAIKEEMEDFLSDVVRKNREWKKSLLEEKIDELIRRVAEVKSVGDEICEMVDCGDIVFDTLNKIKDSEITDFEEAFKILVEYLN